VASRWRTLTGVVWGVDFTTEGHGKTRKSADRGCGDFLTTNDPNDMNLCVLRRAVVGGQWAVRFRLGGRGSCRAGVSRVSVTELVLGGPGEGCWRGLRGVVVVYA
jgi:hypothetical protein